MELTIKQHIYYSNHKPVPIKNIVASLLALEKLVNTYTPEILQQLFPNIEIKNIEVYLDEVKSGSLIEDVAIRLFFRNRENLDLFIDQARESLGLEKIVSKPIVIGAIVAALVLGVLMYKHIKGSSQTSKLPTTVIKGDNNVLIQITEQQAMVIKGNNNKIIQSAAESLHIAPAELQAIIDHSIGKHHDKLSKNVVDFTSPANLEPDATIIFNQDDRLTITSEAIKVIGEMHSNKDSNEFRQDFNEVQVHLRAWDADSAKTGWAAVVPLLSQKRVKLSLEQTIDRESLRNKQTIYADITVLFKLDKESRLLPESILLKQVYPAETLTKG